MSMKRQLDIVLASWAEQVSRKPVLLRGARQTGKTYAVHKLRQKFDSFVEINFEKEPMYCAIFNQDLDSARICRDLGLLKNVEIIPGKTLLFFDEIQACPKAILALRYFYEDMAALHVIGAGSLVEFILGETSMPVGRIDFVFVRPLSFLEFLCATNRELLCAQLKKCDFTTPLSDIVHAKVLSAVREYCFVGGMPSVIKAFWESNSFLAAHKEQRSIIATYREDFNKYAGRAGIELLSRTFDAIPAMVGSKTSFSEIDPDARAYQIRRSLELLEKAMVLYKVRAASGAGVPLSVGASDKHFKTLFLDVGCMQNMLGTNASEWMAGRDIRDIHAGAVAEQFVGQELLVSNDPFECARLFYWHRMARGAQAEVDYLVEDGSKVVPIEVKSSAVGHLKSLHRFLEEYPSIEFGYKVSQENFQQRHRIRSVPFYAVARLHRGYDESVL
ncbi:MAG: ATP-binding protein [Chitinivibrionales bacterium]|nr:ATP-binding protein [Chitinivibrionales bacterium]